MSVIGPVLKLRCSTSIPGSGIHPSKFTEFLYNRITKNQTLAYIYFMTGVTKGEKIPSQLILIFVSEIKNEEYYNSN